MRECVICGLPQTENPHPQAGTPKYLNIIGAMYGCLPCAQKRANGRGRVIQDFKNWLEAQPDGTLLSPITVLEKIRELDEIRRQKYNEKISDSDQD